MYNAEASVVLSVMANAAGLGSSDCDWLDSFTADNAFFFFLTSFE